MFLIVLQKSRFRKRPKHIAETFPFLLQRNLLSCRQSDNSFIYLDVTESIPSLFFFNLDYILWIANNTVCNQVKVISFLFFKLLKLVNAYRFTKNNTTHGLKSSRPNT